MWGSPPTARPWVSWAGSLRTGPNRESREQLRGDSRNGLTGAAVGSWGQLWEVVAGARGGASAGDSGVARGDGGRGAAGGGCRAAGPSGALGRWAAPGLGTEVAGWEGEAVT